jgi:hypothetical protein
MPELAINTAARLYPRCLLCRILTSRTSPTSAFSGDGNPGTSSQLLHHPLTGPENNTAPALTGTLESGEGQRFQ